MQDLNLISVLPPQCSRATTVQALCCSLLSHHSPTIEVQQTVKGSCELAGGACACLSMA